MIHMKISQFLFVSLALLIAACDSLQEDHRISCTKMEVPADQGIPFSGEVSAMRNNLPWNESLGGLIREPNDRNHFGIVALTNYDSETMEIILFLRAIDVGSDGLFWERAESMGFHNVPKRLGTFSLSEFSTQDALLSVGASGLNVGQQEVPAYHYDLEKSEAGYISVDSFEPQSCTIQGTFALTLIRNPLGGGEIKYPDHLPDIYADTLRITDGKFHVPLDFGFIDD